MWLVGLGGPDTGVRVEREGQQGTPEELTDAAHGHVDVKQSTFRAAVPQGGSRFQVVQGHRESCCWSSEAAVAVIRSVCTGSCSLSLAADV